MTLAGLSPVGALTVRAGEPFALHIVLTDADDEPQDLTGREFALAFRHSNQVTTFVTIDAELGGDALSAIALGSAEIATSIYEAGISAAISYDIVEVTGGASVTRFTARVSVAPGPEFPSDTVPVVADLPASEVVLNAQAVVVSERGAQGFGAERRLFDAGLIDEPTVEALNEYLSSTGANAGLEAVEPLKVAAEDARDVAIDARDDAQAAALSAEADRIAAEDAQEGAEAALDAVALIAASKGAWRAALIADAVTTGVSGTDVDDVFTATGDDVDYVGLYRHESGGTATLIASLPTASTVTAIGAEVDTLDASVARAIPPGVSDFPDWIDLTVDALDRPVAGFDQHGRYLLARNGRLSHMFGGGEFLPAPLLKSWSSLTLDSEQRFVSGTRVDGADFVAKAGVITQVPKVPDGVIAAPLVYLWLDLVLDKDDRFVSGARLDGTRWIARGGLILQDGGTSAGGGTTLTAIAAYGDSTTNGDQLDDDVTILPNWQNSRWTNLLAADLGISIVNRGMNGHKTNQIAARAGGIRMSASVTGGSIPASGSVSLTSLSVADPLVIASGQEPYTFTVDLIVDDGTAVRGVLTRTNSTTYSFARSVAGSAKTAATVDIVSVTGRTDMSVFAIIGSLTNDEPGNAGPALTTDQTNVIKANYRALVSAANAGFLCWGPLDRGYQERAGTFNGDFIREMETWLRMEFGSNFVDVRGYLASSRALADAAIVQPGFVPATNADPQLDDAASVAANTIPPSFRYGGVHLNILGHKLQARLFARVLRARFDLLLAA